MCIEIGTSGHISNKENILRAYHKDISITERSKLIRVCGRVGVQARLISYGSIFFDHLLRPTGLINLTLLHPKATKEAI